MTNQEAPKQFSRRTAIAAVAMAGLDSLATQAALSQGQTHTAKQEKRKTALSLVCTNPPQPVIISDSSETNLQPLLAAFLFFLVRADWQSNDNQLQNRLDKVVKMTGAPCQPLIALLNFIHQDKSTETIFSNLAALFTSLVNAAHPHPSGTPDLYPNYCPTFHDTVLNLASPNGHIPGHNDNF